MASEPHVQLRPLGIGEIFDRSITLYVKNFVAFTLIVLTMIAPFGIVQYLVSPNQNSEIQQIVDTISRAGSSKHAAPLPDPLAPFAGGRLVALIVVLAFALLMTPFANNAVAVGVAALYSGRKPAYGAAYARVFRRWLSILAVTLLVGAMLIGVYLAFVFAFVLDLVAATALIQNALPAAIVLFIIGFLLLMIFLAAIVVFFLVGAFSFYAVVIENANPPRAIANSFARLLNRAEFGRALLMSLAMGAVQLGILSISGTVGIVLMLLTRNTIPQIVVSTVINAAMSAFLTVLLSVYYFDVRVRREALDLEVELTQLTTA